MEANTNRTNQSLKKLVHLPVGIGNIISSSTSLLAHYKSQVRAASLEGKGHQGIFGLTCWRLNYRTWGSFGSCKNSGHYISRWQRKLKELPFIHFVGAAHNT